MTDKEQKISILRVYLRQRELRETSVEEDACAFAALQRIGGMAGSWRTDYSECTYYSPQRIDGVLVDLSTIERVRRFHEGLPARDRVPGASE